MRTTIHEVKNSIVTFLLRGVRFRKRSVGVVIGAPFLTAGVVSAVILSLLFALSTPAFAEDEDDDPITIETDGDYTRVRTTEVVNSDGTVTTTEQTRTKNADGTNDSDPASVTASASAGVTNATHVDITIEGTISDEDTGVEVVSGGDEDVTLTNDADIDDVGYGIEFEHDSGGDVTIINNRGITNANDGGISASREGEGYLKIRSDKGISAGDVGIEVRHTDEGDIEIINGAAVRGAVVGEAAITGDNLTGNGTGVFAEHEGTQGNIKIVNGAADTEESVSNISGARVTEAGISGGDTGIYVRLDNHVTAGDVEIVNGSGAAGAIVTAANITGGDIGIHAKNEGATGDIRITNGSDASGGTVTAANITGGEIGIKAEHGGTGGIVIDNQFQVRGGSPTNEGGSQLTEAEINDTFGVSATHTGRGNLEINNSGLIASVSGKGVFAHHEGTQGNIKVKVSSGGSVTSEEGDGIFARHDGMGTINIDVVNNVTARLSAVSVDHNGLLYEGDGSKTFINIYPGSSVSGGDAGVIYARSHANSIYVNLAGTVSSATNTGKAIDIIGGRQSLVNLYPGFSLKGKVIVRTHVPDGGTEVSNLFLMPFKNSSPLGVLDFDGVDFNGFTQFGVWPRGFWKLTGVASEDEAFNSAQINSRATLRFSNVHFKMKESTTRYFVVFYSYSGYEPGTLQVVGANNILSGGLHNRGRLAFAPEGASEEGDLDDTDDRLRVEGGYKGSGDLIFNVDLVRQRANKLTITGDVGEPGHPYGPGNVSMRIAQSLRESSGPLGAGSPPVEKSPTLIEVQGSAMPSDFEGEQDIDDLYHYDLAHRVVPAEINGISRNVNQWYFKYTGTASTARTAALAPQAMSLAMTAYVPPVSSGEAVGSLGLRGDIRGYAGGVWAQRQSLRTSLETGGLVGSRSRTQSDLVHFGYGIPAVGFMGGDMVVGASMSQGFSTSDVSSPTGEGGIDLESHTAALTASWWSSSGFYAGGQTQYTRFSGDISARRRMLVRDNEGIGVSASAEVGYRFDVPLGGMDFSVAPQVQLVWSRVDFDDFTGLQGGLISLENGDLMTGRLSLSWDGEWQDVGGSGRIYGGVSLRDALDGRTAVSVSGVSLASKQGLSADGRLGVSYEWDKGYEVHGEAIALRHDDAEELRANMSVLIDF